ncbi:MAG TPA: HU family DNA-binding protein [Agrococcus sp.]|nr:HU family DNA-binding protein [Agrococcus sp.]
MAETINKTTLASKIAASTDLSQAKVSAVLDALFDEVSDAVKAGNKVSIPGFFSAERTETAARTGRNPQTGEEIKIAAGHRVKLTAGSKLKAAVK